MKKLLFSVPYLLMVLYLTCQGVDLGGKKISFDTFGGVKLVGIFSEPRQDKNKVFILLHGLGSNKEEWIAFSQKLSKAGYGYLYYDARGHGESILTKDNKKINYKMFNTTGPQSEWNKMISDLGEAVNFLTQKKNITRKNIGLIGASLGANISFVYGSKDKVIGPIILLSPGLNYAGIQTDSAISQYISRPIAISASSNDLYAYQSSLYLLNKIKSNKDAVFFPSPAGHGVQMFDGNLENKLLKWIEKY